jgi:hypothetical protein
MVTTRLAVGYPSPDTERPVAPDGTTRVTMLARISGTRNGAEWPRIGEDLIVPAPEAADLIRNFLAKPAPELAERAVVDAPVERAVISRSTKRRS